MLRTPSGGVELPAWSYCYSRQAGGRTLASCGDGGPPWSPPRLDTDGSASFTSPEEDWQFVAEFRPVVKTKVSACRARLRTPVEHEADRYVIPALGPAGVWDVDVSGHSRTEVGNDLITTFRWATSTDSDVVPPARALVGFQNPPSEGVRQGAYGPTVSLEGLFPEPSAAAATLTVTARDGQTQSFTMKRDEEQCPVDGLVTFGNRTAADERDLDGEAPFTYQLEVVLDAATYVGTATWPDDLESPGSSDVLVTHWEPPLPTGTVER